MSDRYDAKVRAWHEAVLRELETRGDTRDWLDEQMDQADLWHEAEELRRDEIEANLPDGDDDEDDN